MSRIHTTMFFWSPFLFLCTVFYYGAFTSVSNVSSCLFIRSTLNGPLESSTCFSKNAVRVQLLPRPLCQQKASHVDDETFNVKKKKKRKSFLFCFLNQSNSAAFAFNWSHFRRSSCHVLGALTDCFNLQNPQIIRLNAVVVSRRQNAWFHFCNFTFQ